MIEISELSTSQGVGLGLDSNLQQYLQVISKRYDHEYNIFDYAVISWHRQVSIRGSISENRETILAPER